MSVRAVSGGGTAEPGRRIVIERAPVIVDDVTDYDIEDDGRVLLWSRGKPAGDFRPGTYQAVYYAAEARCEPQQEPQAKAG